MTDTDTRTRDEVAFETHRADYDRRFRAFVDRLEELGREQKELEAAGHAAASARMTPALMHKNGFTSTARPFVPHVFPFDLAREAVELRRHLPAEA